MTSLKRGLTPCLHLVIWCILNLDYILIIFPLHAFTLASLLWQTQICCIMRVLKKTTNYIQTYVLFFFSYFMNKWLIFHVIFNLRYSLTCSTFSSHKACVRLLGGVLVVKCDLERKTHLHSYNIAKMHLRPLEVVWNFRIKSVSNAFWVHLHFLFYVDKLSNIILIHKTHETRVNGTWNTFIQM